MKRVIFSIVFRFLAGGLGAFKAPQALAKPLPKNSSDTDHLNQEESVLVDLLKGLAEQKEEDKRSFLSPFGVNVSASVKKGASSDPTLFVEGLLHALNLTCGEINDIIPDSDFETWVEAAKTGSEKTYEGHIRWTIDKVTNEVYPICIDLLTDGFIFNASTRTFMITTRIQSSNEK